MKQNKRKCSKYQVKNQQGVGRREVNSWGCLTIRRGDPARVASRVRETRPPEKEPTKGQRNNGSLIGKVGVERRNVKVLNDQKLKLCPYLPVHYPDTFSL